MKRKLRLHADLISVRIFFQCTAHGPGSGGQLLKISAYPFRHPHFIQVYTEYFLVLQDGIQRPPHFLHIHVEQLLYCRPRSTVLESKGTHPAFFDGVSQFFFYVFDGRNNQILRCVFDVLSVT